VHAHSLEIIRLIHRIDRETLHVPAAEINDTEACDNVFSMTDECTFSNVNNLGSYRFFREYNNYEQKLKLKCAT